MITEPAPEPAPVGGDQAGPDEPRFLVQVETLFHIREWAGSGWSWRCHLSGSRLDDGYVHGACRYDHNVDTREQLVAAVTEHLARWHGLRPVSPPPAATEDGLPELTDDNGSERFAAAMAKHGRCTCPTDDDAYCSGENCDLCNVLPDYFPCPTVTHEGYQGEVAPPAATDTREEWGVLHGTGGIKTWRGMTEEDARGELSRTRKHPDIWPNARLARRTVTPWEEVPE